VRFFFADDSEQKKPSRPGMGPLLAIGGVSIPHNALGSLERDLNCLCDSYGFPEGEEFKWSPGRDLWMRENLLGDDRADFFLRMLDLVAASGGVATVIVSDTSMRTVTRASNHLIDLARLYIERVEHELTASGCDGIVIVDRPSGGREAENRFLRDFQETLAEGTSHVKPKHFALNVLATQSIHVRLLQVADVITSCTTARVSGEDRHSPPVFEAIVPMLRKVVGRIGGVGLKINWDTRYINLYHWLVKDAHYVIGSGASQLPWKHLPYSLDPMVE
jgi:hypothetical protein